MWVYKGGLTGDLKRLMACCSICTGLQPTKPSLSNFLVSLIMVPASTAVCFTGKLKQKPTGAVLFPLHENDQHRLNCCIQASFTFSVGSWSMALGDV